MAQIIPIEKERNTPAQEAEMSCVFSSLDIARIANNCALMPEVYLKEYQTILEISFQAHKALEILAQYQRNLIETKYELRG